MQTTISRDREGKLRALTIIDLGSERRQLRIETSKCSFKPGVETGATVVQASEDGLSYTHSFSFGGEGDFSRRLCHNAALRGTERAISAQHQSVLAGVDAIIAAAKAHYATKSVEAV